MTLESTFRRVVDDRTRLTIAITSITASSGLDAGIGADRHSRWGHNRFVRQAQHFVVAAMFTLLAACSPSTETPSSGEVTEDSSASTCRGRADALRADVDGDGRLDIVWRGQSAVSNVVVGLCTAAGATAEVEVGGMGEGDFETIDIEQDGRAEIVQGGTTVSQQLSEVLRFLDGQLVVVGGVLLASGSTRLDTPKSEVVEAWGCEDADVDGVRDLVTVAVSRTRDAAIERRRSYRLHDRSAVEVSNTERLRAAFPTPDERLTMAC